jgi:hypothetical protein
MSDSFSERRQFHRIAFDAATELVQGPHRWSVELQDLSLKGLLVACPPGWDGDASLPFQALVHLSSEVTLSMEVCLSRQQGTQLALACQHIDIDSISHLRRLVELNLGDADLLERELSALGG